jgi:hypothetical protein
MERQALRLLVGDLHSRVDVPDPEQLTDVLAENVTARNLANVTALTNKRKLSERSTDPRRVDTIYSELKAKGHQPVTDRFINVLLKMAEAPELLAVVADAGAEGLAPRDQPAADPPAPPPEPTKGAAWHHSNPLGGLGLAGDDGGTEDATFGGNRPTRPTPSAASIFGRKEELRASGGGGEVPVLAARTLGLQTKKGLAVPTLPDWTRDRPFLTGDFARLAVDSPILMPLSDASHRPAPMPISTFPHAVQEVMIVEELLSVLTGMEGKYIRASVTKFGRLSFSVDSAIDPSLADLSSRIIPLASHAHAVSRYVDVHSRFEYGRVCHAFCAALRHVLKEFYVLVCQLEHQFVKEQLSLQKLWFYVQVRPQR